MAEHDDPISRPEEAVPARDGDPASKAPQKRPDVVKWALGLTTLVSVGYFAIDRLGPGLTPFAVLMGIMVLMMGLILVSAVAAGAQEQRGPARVLLWTVTGLFIGAVALLGTILLFRWPSHLAELVLPRWNPTTLTGSPLAAHEFYPVSVEPDGDLYLDIEKFKIAVEHLLKDRDERAASDLIYLGLGNNVERQLSADGRRQFDALIHRYSDVVRSSIYQDRDRVFEVYRQIVDGIGKTFAGTPIEIVLHDTRNPLASVVAVQNPITGRRVGWPTTNFGVELIKAYATRRHAGGASYAGYPLTTGDGRAIKSTTIPIFDPGYGLVGFVCMNIDISQINAAETSGQTRRFVEAFTTVWDDQAIEEILENVRKR